MIKIYAPNETIEIKDAVAFEDCENGSLEVTDKDGKIIAILAAGAWTMVAAEGCKVERKPNG